MKIKNSGPNKSRRVVEQKYLLKKYKNDEFDGYINIGYFSNIKCAKYVFFDKQRINIWDSGYSWVQYFELGREYSVTVMYNKENVIKQWYIDICKPTQLNNDSQPFFRDMYLDLVILPTGEMEVLDEDELSEALNLGFITVAEYDRAYTVLYEVKELVKLNKIAAINMSRENIEELKDELFKAYARREFYEKN